jgi:hypothetical protein
MKYIVKNDEDKLMEMIVTGSVPSIPGIQVLGLNSELNPEGLDLSRLSWDGEALTEDSAKVTAVRQAKANANLDAIRDLREPLLTDADHSINKADDDGLDLTALKAYRKALRECTDSLKKVNGDAKLTCENLVPEEFEFPVKP